jgi:hypothetical protein
MKITGARVFDGYIVRFRLSDGTHVDRDFAFVRGGVFTPIMRDRELFAKIRVRDGYPSWPGDVDLCPDAVLRGGINRRRPAKFAIIGPRGTLISGRGVKTVFTARRRREIDLLRPETT